MTFSAMRPVSLPDLRLCDWAIAGSLVFVMANLRRVRTLYAGRVQGVGFRYSVRRLACGFEVTGFVRNLADGRVELVVEGDEVELREFLDAISSSELAGHIRHATTDWQPATGQFKQFEISLS